MEQEARICALCKWNKNDGNNFHCSNPIQQNEQLKEETQYNDGCSLFYEKEERRKMYDFWDDEIK